MESRMDRYSNKRNNTTKSRSQRNRQIYNDIYTYGKYSNIEGIAEMDASDKIDLNQVKELLENNKTVKRRIKNRRQNGTDIKDNIIKQPKKRYIDFDERNYDIRDILKEAKEKQVPDDKERTLRNTEYNILKNIDLQKELKKHNSYKNEDVDEEELKDLIQTITNTSMLNKLKDEDLAADLLSDLKAGDTQIGKAMNVENLIKQEEKKPILDESFFTSSLNLRDSDFIDDEEKPSVLAKIILVVLIIGAVVACALIALHFLK